ncbi:hypothetical protein, partial [Jatrophihabitans sp.]|uniref:hypothetical protein n=1 Tax=Jatrophihabitans sp. TaxID=1932789 RepID=UPI002C87C7F1|nr:hypothetical protein [Jatrophihabitans sp.]
MTALLDEVTLFGHQHRQQLVGAGTVASCHHSAVGSQQVSGEAVSRLSRNDPHQTNVAFSLGQQRRLHYLVPVS